MTREWFIMVEIHIDVCDMVNVDFNGNETYSL